MCERIKVSVIVPVYDVEEYIEKCLDTLRNQTLQDLEIIIVDDRSSDRSMDIVREASKHDSRIHIITNEKNIGAGPSRNKGIEFAHGEYLSFIDPDDYISLDFFQRLYTKATRGKSHDIAKGSCVLIDSLTGKSCPSKMNSFIKKKLRKGSPLWNCFYTEHWSAIYKSSLFEKSDIRYGTTRVSEDVIFLLKLGKITRDIVFDKEGVYFYFKRENSLSNTFNRHRAEQLLMGAEEKRDIIVQTGESSYIREWFDRHLRWFYGAFCSSLSSDDLDSDLSKELLDKLDAFLKSLPDYEHHMKIMPEYSLLINHGIVTPDDKRRKKRFYTIRLIVFRVLFHWERF